MVEKVHTDFLKTLLGVKKFTSNVMLYFELGRVPLKCERNYRLLKFWLKLLKSENCIILACYKELVSNCNTSYNFASYVKDLLYDLGLNYVWDSQWEIIIDELLLLQIRQRLEDHTKQELRSSLDSSSKCSLYKFMVSSFNLQFY